MIDNSRLTFLGKGIIRLHRALITVVGGGGGGSHVVQQLAHVGAGIVAVVDPDKVERSNVNRLPCFGYSDIGRPKAVVLAERLARLGGKVVSVIARAESHDGRGWLERSDLVIGAVDGIRTRSNIESICRHALVPYIDIGLGIDVADDGSVRSIGGQVVTSLPGGRCLRCVEVITDAGIVADREEYTVGAPDQQVISMNGLLASQAVNNALALLTNYATEFQVPTIVRYDGLLHQMRPDPEEAGKGCAHYTVDGSGWTTVLPSRKAAS
jgi:molybdopterin/thiamine biosynthesis adenylyltransferase